MTWREYLISWKDTDMTLRELVAFVESKRSEYPGCEFIVDGDSGCIMIEHPGLEGCR